VTPWEPVKIDKPYNPKGAIIGKPRKPLVPRKKTTHRAARLDEEAPGQCPDAAQGDARLEGRRPKCKARFGEHVCVLAGAVPESAQPLHAGMHACSCGRRWA